MPSGAEEGRRGTRTAFRLAIPSPSASERGFTPTSGLGVRLTGYNHALTRLGPAERAPRSGSDGSPAAALGSAGGSVAISIHIESDSGLAIVTCSGRLGASDARDHAEALWKAPGWLGRAVVWDFRDAEFDASSTEIREVARFTSQHQPETPPSRVAFVARRDVDFGQARIFEVFRKGPPDSFRVFRDYDEALSWARAAT